jgi:hypothetical protein
MYVYYQLVKARQDELQQAAARHRLAAQARRARAPRPRHPMVSPARRLAAMRPRRLFPDPPIAR